MTKNSASQTELVEEANSVAQARVRHALAAAGWKLRESRALLHAAFAVSHGSSKYVVAVKTLREGRHALIEAVFADAALRARADLRAGERALVFVVLPRPSPRIVERLRRYAEALAPDADWAVLGDAGIAGSHGAGLEASSAAFERRPRGSARGQVRFDLFSDLNQWLLKVLLAQPRDDGTSLLPAFLAAPRPSASADAIRNGRQLAQRARVSEPTAARFLVALESGGWIADRKRSMQLQRIPELLERWRAAASRPELEVGARFLFPPDDPLAALAVRLNPQSSGTSIDDEEARDPGAVQWNAAPRACFALFAALKHLRKSFVAGAPIHVHAELIDDALLSRLGLRRARAGEPVDVFLRVPRATESVFRAAVQAPGLIPCTDIVQCWLDVANHPVRGAEQAAEVWKFLAPRLDLDPR